MMGKMNLQAELTRLLALSTITAAERKLLSQAQAALTKSSDVHVAKALKLQLSLMAAKQQLSAPMVAFLTQLNQGFAAWVIGGWV